MILFIMGYLSSNKDKSQYSGMIVFKLGLFSLKWDDCL